MEGYPTVSGGAHGRFPFRLESPNSDKCPLCRNLCYIEDKPLTIHKEEEESNCEVNGHVAGESRRISEGEVHGQAAAASSAAGKSNNVRQALLRTFLGLFSLVCMILFFRFMMY
jgi:hypothetical protein